MVVQSSTRTMAHAGLKGWSLFHFVVVWKKFWNEKY